jgi:uncharacterized RDD family membrane protein YckC
VGRTSDSNTAISFAGFGQRLSAWIIDSLIVFAAYLLLSIIAAHFLRTTGLWVPAESPVPLDEQFRSFGIGTKLLIFFAFSLSQGPIYFALLEASGWQATFGKRMMSICVAGDDGNRIGTARSFGRSLAKWGLNLFAGGLVSALLIASSDHRAIHDHTAHTVVVRGRPTHGGTLAFWRVALGLGLPTVIAVGVMIHTL